MTDDRWQAMLEAYYLALREYHAEAVRRALSMAWREYPDWMPTAGQLARLAADEQRRARRRAIDRRLLTAGGDTDREAARERIAEILATIGRDMA